MKILIVGIGGRVGTMFAFELKKDNFILGVGEKENIEKIKEGKVFVERQRKIEKFELNVVSKEEFEWKENFDFLFLCTKNPVREIIKFYFSKIKSEKIPALILPQNGILAAEEAKEELKKIFGEKEIEIYRLSLFNTIYSESFNSNLKISYSLPIKLAFGPVGGEKNLKSLAEIFKKANFDFEIIPKEKVKAMEYSKLFLNLIGMVCEAENLSLKEGFEKKEIFEKEILVLKEYIKVVKKSGGEFLNFKKYPIAFFTFLIDFLPANFLSPFRKILKNFILKGREGREKLNLNEIDYYNGTIWRMGEKLGFSVEKNKEVYFKIKRRLLK